MRTALTQGWENFSEYDCGHLVDNDMNFANWVTKNCENGVGKWVGKWVKNMG